LKIDIEKLPKGDQTPLSKKGLNLSRSQRDRIQIARAVYANKDIYLMDHPLAVMETNVRNKINDEVFIKLLRDKTRVLVSN